LFITYLAWRENKVFFLRFQGQQAEPDFKGGAGAGATSVINQGVSKTKVKRAEPESPETPLEEDLSDSEIDVKDTKELVPVRQSARAVKKSYKYKSLLFSYLSSVAFHNKVMKN
jgi:hypothetical protein